MGEDKGRTALAAGVGLTAGALAALLIARQARAAVPEGEMTVSLDDPGMQALISILDNAEALGVTADQILDAVNRLAASFGVVTLENPEDITAFRVLTTAVAVPIQLPDRPVPYDKELVVKALHTNTGVILVAPSQASAVNINSSYWLIANEAVEYKIRNADHIWIGVHPTLGVVGDGVVCTVEQERR